MATITTVDGEDTEIVTDDDAIATAQVQEEFSPPVMWSNPESDAE